MIWAVKILALNKKDGKGKDLNFSTKKSLPTKIPPKSKKRHIFRAQQLTTLSETLYCGLDSIYQGLFEFYAKRKNRDPGDNRFDIVEPFYSGHHQKKSW